MLNLLNAGVTRARKNKIFIMVLLFSVLLALFMIYASYSDMKNYGVVIELEQLMINYSTISGIVIAIFTSLFLGVEYSDGGNRNKIINGNKRVNIYLSNLIIVSLVSIISYLLFILVIIVFGLPLFGWITIPISKLLMLIGCIFVMILSYSSIFTFIAMVIENKAITAIATIMLSFLMMMVALTCLNILTAPKFIQSATITNEETGQYEFVQEPNPKYPSETKKKVCQILLDINPAGQAFEIAGRVTPNLKILPLYSLGIIVIFTSSGLILFKRKDLK